MFLPVTDMQVFGAIHMGDYPVFTLLLVMLQSRAAEASSKAASGSGGVWRSKVKDRLHRMSVANMVPDGLVLSRNVKASARHGKTFYVT